METTNFVKNRFAHWTRAILRREREVAQGVPETANFIVRYTKKETNGAMVEGAEEARELSARNYGRDEWCSTRPARAREFASVRAARSAKNFRACGAQYWKLSASQPASRFPRNWGKI